MYQFVDPDLSYDLQLFLIYFYLFTGDQCKENGMVLIRLVAIQMYQYCPLGRAVLSYWHICIFKLFFSLLLIRIGYTDEAAMYIRKSLEINPDYTAARENLDNICCHLVERWHFRMLNDVNRNTAFLSALQKAAKLGYTSVLDMGAGTGILR